MRKNIVFIAKGLVFCLLLAAVLGVVQRIVTPQWTYEDTWPTTETYKGFYSLEKDTAQVLFLGTSHGASAFYPQELYDSYGITSYNLSCEQQSLFTSYYWLKEALRTQSPQVVVLDYYYMTFSEAQTRKALEPMKWSSVKWEALREACRLSGDDDLLSWIFPLAKYHDRWESLDRSSFTASEDYALKGYAPCFGKGNVLNYYTFTAEDGKPAEHLQEIAETYLQKIADLCNENGISLFMVSTPCVQETVEESLWISEWAEQNGVFFADMNVTENFEDSGFVFTDDLKDSEHANVRGAMKITDYVGSYLTSLYGLEPTVQEAWEESRAYSEAVKTDFALNEAETAEEWLMLAAQAKDEGQILFIVSRGGCEELLPVLSRSGFDALLPDALPENGQPVLLAVTGTGESDTVQVSASALAESGWLKDDSLQYALSAGGGASVLLDGEEYCVGKNGINIVVFNPLRRTVADSVCLTEKDGALVLKRE